MGVSGNSLQVRYEKWEGGQSTSGPIRKVGGQSTSGPMRKVGGGGGGGGGDTFVWPQLFALIERVETRPSAQ